MVELGLKNGKKIGQIIYSSGGVVLNRERNREVSSRAKSSRAKFLLMLKSRLNAEIGNKIGR